MRPRQIVAECAVRSGDSDLINLDASITKLLGQAHPLLIMISIISAFKYMVIIGKADRIYNVKFVIFFKGVMNLTGRDVLQPCDLVSNGIKLCSARYGLYTNRDDGYLTMIKKGYYVLSDKGIDLYRSFLLDVQSQLTGPFRWRP